MFNVPWTLGSFLGEAEPTPTATDIIYFTHSLIPHARQLLRKMGFGSEKKI